MFSINSSLIHNVILKKKFIVFRRPKTTFYDVLNLKKECSSKEIKDSYIKLSKLYHPDKTKNSQSAHQKFVKINEAYNTLSKPDLRRTYDFELEHPKPTVDYKNYHQAYDTSMYENPIFTRYKSNSGPAENEYYGVKGIKKQPHFVIVFLCVGIALVGFAIQMVLVRTSFLLRRDKLQRESEENERLLEQIRRTSELNGNELQIEILRKKFEQEELRRKQQRG